MRKVYWEEPVDFVTTRKDLNQTGVQTKMDEKHSDGFSICGLSEDIIFVDNAY